MSEAATPRAADAPTFQEVEAPVPAALDSLLSPAPSDSEPHNALRDSGADSDAASRDSLVALALDDDNADAGEGAQTLETDLRFSTIPLSARPSSATLSGAGGSDDGDGDSLRGLPPASPTRDRRRTTVHLASARSSTLAGESVRARSASGSSVTSASAGGLPFLLRGLDLQKVPLDGAGSGSARGSRHDLKEEFNRIHERDLQSDKSHAAIDWNFWGAVVSDYQAFAADRSEELAKAIEKGIPQTLRGMMWQLMSASKDPELEATYLRLLKESSTHEKAITRDLGRTFPHHSVFTDSQGIGQENLFNVLKAYSLYDEQVGYCQGLPFVVAILLLNMPDEEAFCLLVRLMHSYDIRGHFLPEMPKLQLRLFQFDRLLEEMLPVLHVHFLRQGIKSSMYTSQWFLTLFSYRFPLEIVYRIYDNILASGVEAIFAFSLVLLYKNEQTLLGLKFDEILVFINTRIFEVYEESTVDPKTDPKTYKVTEYVNDAISLRITPFMLDSYAREYEDMVRQRDAQMTEMDELRNSNRNLSAQVKSLETSMAQLNREHVELLNELVRSRLKNEDTESELVRYKLLYAEAMHKSEDAMSNSRLSNTFSFFTGKRGSG